MKTAKVIFYLKADKTNTVTGEQPIYCRITVDGKRSNISINRWVHPTRWVETNKLQKARKNEDKELNFYMESIRAKIKEIERELIDNKTPVTSENIKNLYTDNTTKSKTLIEIFEWHNINFNEMVNSEERSEANNKSSSEYVEIQDLLYKAEKLDPANADIHFLKGWVSNHFEYYENAIINSNEAIRLNPKHFSAYYNRGSAKFLMSDHSGALADFSKAIELKPDFHEAIMDKQTLLGIMKNK